MARPKIVRTKEEAAAVPADLPIQVEVAENQPVEVPVKTAANGGLAPPAPPAAPEPPKPDPEVTTLKKQLADLRRQNDEAIAQARQREAQLRQQYEGRNQEYQTAANRAHAAEIDAVNNAVAALKGEKESARSAYQIARAAGDAAAELEASERFNVATFQLAKAEDYKATLDERGERSKTQQQPVQQAIPSTEAQIDAMNISPEQKVWFKKHPEILFDRRKMTKAENAHYDALDKGLTMNSPEYFAVIDQAMGYAQAPPIEEEADDEPPPQTFSAPPSREAPSASTGRPTTTRITLTAAQREAARDAGVDEVTYARGLLELQRRKQLGNYPDA